MTEPDKQDPVFAETIGTLEDSSWRDVVESTKDGTVNERIPTLFN